MNQPLPSRIALYARFSSDLQNSSSANDQLASLRDQIRRRHHDWDVVREERDEAVSGTSMEGRDGLKRLLAAAALRPRPFDAVVVEDLSRLARSQRDSIEIRGAFASYGVTVLSAADGFVDPDSEAGFFLSGFKEMKAEADSRETGRRVRRGVKARTQQGWVSGRRTPFGYRRIRIDSPTERDLDGNPVRLGYRFVVDPVTAPVVQFVFDHYAAGVGMHRIATMLNDPAGPYRALKPRGYVVSFLRSMLLNETYVGRLVYAATQEKKVRVGHEVKRRKIAVPRDEQAVKHDAHEAIVDLETWSRVQAKFQARKGTHPHIAAAMAGSGRAPASILSGLVRCADCGGSFTITTCGPNRKQRARGMTKSQRRFACSRRASSGKDVCSNGYTIEAGILERRVLDALESRVLTPEGLAFLEDRRRELLLDGLREIEARAPAVEKEWAETVRAESRVVEAIKAGVAIDAIRDEAARLQARRADLERERGQLALVARLQAAAAERQVASSRLERLRDILQLPDLNDVRVALKGVIVRIEVGGDGGAFMLIGEGPLEPLPGGGGLTLENFGSSPSCASRARPALAAGDVPGAGPVGHRPGSRLSMVGATGFEPATS